MFNEHVLKTEEMFRMLNMFNVFGKYEEAGGFPPGLNILNILNISPLFSTFREDGPRGLNIWSMCPVLATFGILSYKQKLFCHF